MTVSISGARGHFGEGRRLTCHTYAFSKSIEFQGLEKGSEAFRVIPLHATCHTYAFSKSVEFQGLEKGSDAFRAIPLHATSPHSQDHRIPGARDGRAEVAFVSL